MKRQIKAHKGDRTERIFGRVTSEEKELIDRAKKDLSYSDFIVKAAKKELGIKDDKNK